GCSAFASAGLGYARGGRSTPVNRDFVASSNDALALLAPLLGEAGSARRLVSGTVPIEVRDPSAAVFASRLAGDRWFCWEQPDRGGVAIAPLGEAHAGGSRGHGGA